PTRAGKGGSSAKAGMVRPGRGRGFGARARRRRRRRPCTSRSPSRSRPARCGPGGRRARRRGSDRRRECRTPRRPRRARRGARRLARRSSRAELSPPMTKLPRALLMYAARLARGLAPTAAERALSAALLASLDDAETTEALLRALDGATDHVA